MKKEKIEKAFLEVYDRVESELLKHPAEKILQTAVLLSLYLARLPKHECKKCNAFLNAACLVINERKKNEK